MVGLKCDQCGNTEMVEHVSDEYIGKECEVCRANVLTQEDYDGAVKMMEALRAIESLGLVKITDEPSPNSIRVGFHNGEFTIKHTLDG